MDLPSMISRQDLLALESTDILASYRGQFDIPNSVIHLDGGTLGAQPKLGVINGSAVLKEECTTQTIISPVRNQLQADFSVTIGSKVAKLIGAHGIEVVVGESLPVILWKIISIALKHFPDRKTILLERFLKSEFDSLVDSVLSISRGGISVKYFENEENMVSSLDSSVALTVLSHVAYDTGKLKNLHSVTTAVHNAGSWTAWDVSVSAGVYPLTLTAAGIDFAFGTGSRYLNGGSSAPSFVYCSASLMDTIQEDLGITTKLMQLLCSPAPVINASLLEIGVDMLLEIDMQKMREKSVNLTSFFLRLMKQECDEFGFQSISPTDPELRGSHVSFTHANAYPIVQSLGSRGILTGYIAPDIIRFSFNPLYVSFTDIWNSVKHLKMVMDLREWDQPRFYR